MGATSALLLAQAHPERVDRLVLRSPPPFGDDMIPVRRALYGLALMYRVLGVTVTARLVALRPGDGERARTHALARGQRRAAIAGASRVSCRTARHGAPSCDRAPTLVLTQPGDALHPLRSGEVLNSLMPAAALCVAPSRWFWRDHCEDMADLIAAFIEGRDDDARHASTTWACAFTTTRQESCTSSSDASSRLRLTLS